MFPDLEVWQEKLGIIESKIDAVKADTEALREGLLPLDGPVLPTLHDVPISAALALYTAPPIKFPHRRALLSANFSRDGRRIVTTGKDGTVTIWRVDNIKSTDKRLKVAEHKGEAVIYASFSPDGNLIVTASADDTACLWYSTVENIKPIQPPFKHHHDVTTASFSPNGQCIVTSSWDGTAKIWSVSGSLLRPIKLPPLESGPDTDSKEDDRAINSAYFSPDGELIVTACSISSPVAGVADSFVHTWSAKTGDLTGKFMGHQGGACSAEFSRDGKWIVGAGANDNTAQIWDAKNFKRIAILGGKRDQRHEDTIWCAAFSPDASRVVTASNDAKVYVWDVASKSIVGKLPHDGAVITASFSPCGKRVLSACDDGNAYLWTLS